MGKRLVADDSSLLGRVLSLASQKAQTLESISSEMDMPAQEISLYWFMANNLRKCQGHYLPFSFDTVVSDDGRLQYLANSWYCPTWRLNELLEQFQLNEGLAVHYAQTLTDPEGGHYELNLAAGEVVAAVLLENKSADIAKLKRVCVQACEPTNGVELLVSNAGKILLNIEKYRETPITSLFIEDIYAKLTEGIAVKESHDAAQPCASPANELRAKTLEIFCANTFSREAPAVSSDEEKLSEKGLCSSHTLVKALVALHFFKTLRLFPAGNDVLSYVMYFLILHRVGYHFSAHVPVMNLLYQPEGEGSKHPAPEELVTQCDGTFDWTGFFEQAIQQIIEEQRWTMTKLDGMSRRRERFRTIIDADESLNYRQKEVLLEAVLHSNAEFTYGIHEQRYDVSYPCARSDFARLLDAGFMRQHDDGIRHFFVAADSFSSAFLTYLQEHCPDAFYRYYHEDGALRDNFKSSEDAAYEYNKDVGFYEKVLLDKTYIEHYDFRRTRIADCDGPRRHSQSKD